MFTLNNTTNSCYVSMGTTNALVGDSAQKGYLFSDGTTTYKWGGIRVTGLNTTPEDAFIGTNSDACLICNPGDPLNGVSSGAVIFQDQD